MSQFVCGGHLTNNNTTGTLHIICCGTRGGGLTGRRGGDHGKDQGGVGEAKHQAAQAASLPPRRAREDVGRDQGLGSGLLNEFKQRRRARGGVRAALVSG